MIFNELVVDGGRLPRILTGHDNRQSKSKSGRYGENGNNWRVPIAPNYPYGLQGKNANCKDRRSYKAKWLTIRHNEYKEAYILMSDDAHKSFSQKLILPIHTKNILFNYLKYIKSEQNVGYQGLWSMALN